eukprot:8861779-Karenia_brevis.AAC.1
MSVRKAQGILKSLNTNKPFGNRKEFIDTLLALVIMFPKAVKRRSSQRPVHASLVHACSPESFELYLNGNKYLKTLSQEDLTLVQTGTTGNEAVHRQIKPMILTGLKMHAVTLALKFEVFQTMKLLCWTTAVGHKTTHQMPEDML